MVTIYFLYSFEILFYRTNIQYLCTFAKVLIIFIKPMEINRILEPLIFIIISLICGGLLKVILKKSIFPYTVGLFIFGFGIGLLGRLKLLSWLPAIDTSFNRISEISPNLILYLFLPILIFEGAYELDFHIFKKTLINALLLAIPGLIFCALATAAVIMIIHGTVTDYNTWTWSIALMFGALISATDPVAVVSLLNELKMSKRFSTLVDTESMLNDGTGIVLFMIFYSGLTINSGTTIGGNISPLLDFVFVVFGGIGVGLLIAYITMIFITKIAKDEMVQISIVITASYLVFLIAEAYLEVSGVIALVTYGLYISYYGHLRFKPKAHQFMSNFWKLAAYIGNTLIFIIVGVVIAMNIDFTWINLIVLLALFIAINVIRSLMIFLFRPIMKKTGFGLTKNEAIILSWGGLRGALGLTLGLIVFNTPAIPENIRQQILFQTGGIVALTLTFNATTISPLLKRIGLDKISPTKQFLKYSAHRLYINSIQEYYREIRDKGVLDGSDWELVEKSLPQERNDTKNGKNFIGIENLTEELRIRVVRHEKLYLWDIYNIGIINSHSLEKLQSLADIIFDHDGKDPLTIQEILFDELLSRGTKLLWFKAPSWYLHFLDRYFPARTVARYDITRGFTLIQQESIRLLKEYTECDIFTPSEGDSVSEIEGEIMHNIHRADQYMSRLHSRHPESFKMALTHKAIRMIRIKEKKIKLKLTRQGIM